MIIYFYNRRVNELKRREAEQLLKPIREVLEESENPKQLQNRIRNILDNQQRYKKSVSKSVEADREEVMKSTRPLMERVMEIMEQNYMNSEFGAQEFCEMLGMSVQDVAGICIEGMKPYAAEIGLLGTEA